MVFQTKYWLWTQFPTKFSECDICNKLVYKDEKKKKKEEKKYIYIFAGE